MKHGPSKEKLLPPGRHQAPRGTYTQSVFILYDLRLQFQDERPDAFHCNTVRDTPTVNF